MIVLHYYTPGMLHTAMPHRVCMLHTAMPHRVCMLHTAIPHRVCSKITHRRA